MKYVFVLLICITTTTQVFSSSNAWSKDSLTVYLFLSDECVITQYYVPTINDLHAEFGAEFNFVAVFPNFSSKPKKISAFYHKYQLSVPHITDYYKSLSKAMDAQVTPEVVIYNHTTDTKLYQGKIDNSYAAIGKRRRVITSHELHDALRNIQDGKKINQTYTKAIGCFINFNDQLSKSN